MSYTKTTWADDDVITAEGMNNMENGIHANDQKCAKNAPLYVPIVFDMEHESVSTTAVFADVAAAVAAGRTVVTKLSGMGDVIQRAPLTGVDDEETPTEMHFELTTRGSGDVTHVNILFTSGGVTAGFDTLATAPEEENANAGEG